MMRILVWILFGVATLITLRIIWTDDYAAHNYVRWGGSAEATGGTMVLLALRWAVFSVAFGILGLSGGPKAWGTWPTIFAVGSVFVFEITSYFIHSTAVKHDVERVYQITYSVIALLLPLVIIASGVIASRALFFWTVAATFVIAVVGGSGEKGFMAKPHPPTLSDLVSLVDPSGPPKRRSEVIAAIESMPEWRMQLVGLLKVDPMLQHLYVLCREPEALTDAEREHCWTALEKVVPQLEEQENIRNAEPGETAWIELGAVARALAAKPDALRDRHRPVFVAARDLIRRARVKFPSLATLDDID